MTIHVPTPSRMAYGSLHTGHPAPLDSHPFSEFMTTMDLTACTLTFIDEDIVHAHFKDGLIAGPEAVDEMFNAIRASRNGRKALLMVSVGIGASLTNEARNHASSDAGSELIAADAIVRRPLACSEVTRRRATRCWRPSGLRH